jgi:hypothetical protein
VTIINDGAGKITFTVQANNNALAGIYYVSVKATLAPDVTWNGMRPMSTWLQYFMVSIIDPCGSPGPPLIPP